MMAKMTKYTQPAEQHELLGMFVGEWDVVTQLMMGGQEGPKSTGTSVTTWKKKGRWIESAFVIHRCCVHSAVRHRIRF